MLLQYIDSSAITKSTKLQLTKSLSIQLLHMSKKYRHSNGMDHNSGLNTMMQQNTYLCGNRTKKKKAGDRKVSPSL